MIALMIEVMKVILLENLIDTKDMTRDHQGLLIDKNVTAGENSRITGTGSRDMDRRKARILPHLVRDQPEIFPRTIFAQIVRASSSPTRTPACYAAGKNPMKGGRGNLLIDILVLAEGPGQWLHLQNKGQEESGPPGIKT